MIFSCACSQIFFTLLAFKETMAFNTKGKIFCAIFLIVIILCFSIFSCWYLMRHFAVYNRETRRHVGGQPQRSTATSGQVPTYQNHHKVPGIENKRKLVRILTEKLWSHCADNFNGTSKNELSTRFVASSLSTLFLVGMKDQFYQFHPKKVQIFNASNAKFYYSEYIASLLSSYALTKDTNFENLAFEAVYQNRNFYEFSSNTLEYWYLFKITNDSRFSQEVERHLSSSSLNSSKISEDTIQFLSTLIKLYALTNRTNELSIQLYKRTLDQLENSGAFLRTEQNQTFFKDGPDYMNSSSCLLGAILSQGGELMLTSLQQTGKQLGNERAIQERARINRHWQLAEQITQTCAQLSQRYSGLLPERIYFNDNENQNQDNSNFKIRFLLKLKK